MASDHLDLVLARGYVSKLITNARVTRYLEMYHPEFCLSLKRSRRRRPWPPDSSSSANFGWSCDRGPGPIEARGPQETPHSGADQVRRWGWRRTRAGPTKPGLSTRHSQ